MQQLLFHPLTLSFTIFPVEPNRSDNSGFSHVFFALFTHGCFHFHLPLFVYSSWEEIEWNGSQAFQSVIDHSARMVYEEETEICLSNDRNY